MSPKETVLDLLVRYEELAKQGKPPSLEKLCADCPELLPELRQQLVKLGTLQADVAGMFAPEGKTRADRSAAGSVGRTVGNAHPHWTRGRSTTEHDPALTDFLAPAEAAGELGRLGKYRILDVVGRGGMGVVYKAEDSVLRRRVALKAILPSLGANATVRKRFLREARSLAAVEHDHIVRLYEVNEDRGVSFIAMEFLAGTSLSTRLVEGERLSVSEVLRIGREVADGLATAHARNLVHRDIKPANIWLEARPNLPARVKILDFGLARAEEDSRITASGAVLGTPAYMSPEQSRGEQLDFRSDLFSLGVVLYRLTTDSEPFTGPDGISTMLAIATVMPTPPQVRNFDVPADLSDLIMQLLEKEPANRPGSARAVAEAIGRIERGEAAPVVKKAQVPIATIVATSPKRSTRRTWLILAALTLAVFGCLGSALVIAALAAFR